MTIPNLRKNVYIKKRIFFMTPQTMINDLKNNIIDDTKIALIVID